MRALVCEAYGPVENLKIADLAVPEPKAGEILVRVGAAGVSFAALLGVQGKHQNKPALPYVPGNEMAGHVVKLGPGVTGVAVGQRITTGVSQGAYADFAARFRKLQAQLGKSPPPSIISDLIVKALKAKRPATRYHGGRLASPLLFLRRVLPDRMLDALILRAFR